MTEEEMFNQLWFGYPTDLCRNKRGGKQPAFKAFQKLKVDETEFKRIMLNMQAQARNDRNDPDHYRWPFVSSYLNQRRFDDTIDIVEKPAYVGSQCAHAGCMNEVHGSRYQFCAEHLPEPPNPILDKLRQKYQDLSLATKTPQQCREMYREILSQCRY